MLKKDPSRSDDLLSSYSCSKFEKCSFEKNAFKDFKDFQNFKLVVPLNRFMTNSKKYFWLI